MLINVLSFTEQKVILKVNLVFLKGTINSLVFSPKISDWGCLLKDHYDYNDDDHNHHQHHYHRHHHH